VPPLTLDLSRCLVQPMPEYPRREHVFCVSLHTGDAYLIQVSVWLNGVHHAYRRRRRPKWMIGNRSCTPPLAWTTREHGTQMWPYRH
jgi:hypothetical protein